MSDLTPERENEFLDRFVSVMNDEDKFSQALEDDKVFQGWVIDHSDDFEALKTRYDEREETPPENNPEEEEALPSDPAPKAPAEDPEARAESEEIDIKIRADLLKAYLRDNQSPSEAIERLVNESDNLRARLDHYSAERMPEMERAREEAEAELAKIRSQLKKYEEQAQQQATPQQTAAQQNPAKGTPQAQEPGTQDDDAPEYPSMPDPLSGEDQFDDAKVAEYREAIKAYHTGMRDYQQKFAKWQAKQIERNIRAELASTGDTETVKALQQELAELKAQSQTTAQNDRVAREFQEIDDMVAANQHVLGETTRTVAEIESDYLRFVQDMARMNGVQGSIYKRNSTEFRPEVTGLLQKYRSQTLPGSDDFRTSLTQRGITLPQDINTLFNVYQVRKEKQRLGGKASYDDALAIALRRGVLAETQQQTAPQPQPAPQATPQTAPPPPAPAQQPRQSGEALEAYQKRMRAKQNLNQGVAEPTPGDEGGTDQEANHDQLQKFLSMLDIPKERRTEEDWQYIENQWRTLPNAPEDESLRGAADLDYYWQTKRR